MKFLHFQVTAGPGKVIRVLINNPANVWLMDSVSFQKYKMKKTVTCTGGRYATSPVDFRPPHKATWHVVVDTDGLVNDVTASVKVLS